jgi:N-acylneuraminate cytidylyltransferase/CMP-N,N'-diacetyllegionaminic acid synthase
MMDSKHLEVLGIIGIRSGSKGVPNKNIKNLFGKPLVGWILDVAKHSDSITRLVVSTDSKEYAQLAESLGAEIPCLRPEELAKDKSSEYDYVLHMLEWLKNNESYIPDIVVRMMETVPLQTSEDINAVIEILKKDSSADSAVVIAEARQHPLKALKIIEDENGGGKLVTYFSNSGREVTPIARQNYETAYFRANVIACRTAVVYDTKSLTGDTVRYHIIPQERAVDIDNLIDFYIAEQLISRNQ